MTLNFRNWELGSGCDLERVAGCRGHARAGCITLVVLCARGACAAPTFADVALPDEPPQQVRAVVAVRGLVEGLLGEGVGALGRGRGLRHGGRAGRAGRARYSCRGAKGRAALSERLSRPTIAARLPPAPARPPAPSAPSAPPAPSRRALGTTCARRPLQSIRWFHCILIILIKYVHKTGKKSNDIAI